MTNLLVPETFCPGKDSCPLIEGVSRISEGYLQYCTDESKSTGRIPTRIYFPETTRQVQLAVREVRQRGESLTVSGARTGIAGAAVPTCKNLLSLDRKKGQPEIAFDPARNAWQITSPAGVTLEEIETTVRERNNGEIGAPPDGLYYPVDPTETTASIGGTAATNASGARTLRYGPTRDWIRGLSVVLPSGSVLELTRGSQRVVDGCLRLAEAGSKEIDLCIPEIQLPSTKHTAGYFLKNNMDAIDLFIGSEGTLGIITDVTLELTAQPKSRLGLVLFLKKDDPVELVRWLKGYAPLAIEYMDANSVRLLINSKSQNLDGGAVPELPKDTRAVLYVEFGFQDETAMEQLYEDLDPRFADFAVDADSSWAGFTAGDLAAMKRFRHALPERINAIIAERKQKMPELSKIGTDMAVPDTALPHMLEIYREGLSAANLEYCMFGHIGNAHLHINILPRSLEEKSVGYELYRSFATKAVEFGGSVSGEHGIGSLKREFLAIQFDEREIQVMKNVKRFFDPELMLNPGVLF